MSFNVWETGFDYQVSMNPGKDHLHILQSLVEQSDKFYVVQVHWVMSVDGALLQF